MCKQNRNYWNNFCQKSFWNIYRGIFFEKMIRIPVWLVTYYEYSNKSRLAQVTKLFSQSTLSLFKDHCGVFLRICPTVSINILTRFLTSDSQNWSTEWPVYLYRKIRNTLIRKMLDAGIWCWLHFSAFFKNCILRSPHASVENIIYNTREYLTSFYYFYTSRFSLFPIWT